MEKVLTAARALVACAHPKERRAIYSVVHVRTPNATASVMWDVQHCEACGAIDVNAKQWTRPELVGDLAIANGERAIAEYHAMRSEVANARRRRLMDAHARAESLLAHHVSDGAWREDVEALAHVLDDCLAREGGAIAEAAPTILHGAPVTAGEALGPDDDDGFEDPSMPELLTKTKKHELPAYTGGPLHDPGPRTSTWSGCTCAVTMTERVDDPDCPLHGGPPKERARKNERDAFQARMTREWKPGDRCRAAMDIIYVDDVVVPEATYGIVKSVSAARVLLIEWDFVIQHGSAHKPTNEWETSPDAVDPSAEQKALDAGINPSRRGGR